MVDSVIKWELAPPGTTHIMMLRDCFYWEKYTDSITRWVWEDGRWVKNNTQYSNNYIRITK